MQNLLNRFLRDEEGSVVQTVLLAAGGVALAVGVAPILGITDGDGTSFSEQLRLGVVAAGVDGDGN
jgi:Flp pilus assembly pilin Flp